jgi:hypothetical protein
MTTPHSERRRSQRVDAQLQVHVQIPVRGASSAPAALKKINISTSGVYFHSDRFIEPMTKLEMFLDLPFPDPVKAGEAQTQRVRCEGIVVRVLPEVAQPGDVTYEIAVFFTNFEHDALARLEEHILTLLATS